MEKDILMVICFVIVLIASCQIYHLLMMKQYRKGTIRRGTELIFGGYINYIEKIELAGIDDDENGDYDVCQAIKKIDLPEDTRIKIDE